MHLDLSDDQTAAPARLLRKTIDDDRYPLSPRIRLLQVILDKIDPPRAREPLPPLKAYEPPVEPPPLRVNHRKTFLWHTQGGKGVNRQLDGISTRAELESVTSFTRFDEYP
jgi:hypothetical protein